MKKITKISLGLLGILALGFIVWNILPLLSEKHIEEELSFSINELSSSSQKQIQNTQETIPTVPETQETSETRLLASGNFVGTDVETSGTVGLIDTGENIILQFEDLQTSNGPDLFVYLSTKQVLTNESDLQDTSIRIAKLKGNSGNQTYIIPDNIDISEYNSVAIHCRAYNHSFGYASLK